MIRKLGDKLNIVIFSGSPRDPDTCSGQISKTHKVVDYILEKWDYLIDFEFIDLSVNLDKKPNIQPCKGCVSTAGGFHCHFSCSCFKKGSKKQPDLLKELDVYEKLEKSDGFIVVTPIHWYSVSSQVKLLFDRLVCINQTLRKEDAINLMGSGNIKNPEITGKFSKSGEYNNLLRNHLEGKFCAFYAHGDDGANDYYGKEFPKSYDPLDDTFSKNPKSILDPFVLQMKYSGVFVPNNFIESFYINKGVDYYSANKDPLNDELFERADKLINAILDYSPK
jgi:multimeric flavodoxin WrbA